MAYIQEKDLYPMLKLCPHSISTEIYTKYQEKSNHPSDAGYDLYIPQRIVVPAHSRGFLIDHSVSAQLTFDGKSSSSYILVPRSSIIKTPLRMSNSIGIIDSSYRGHLFAAVDNISDTDYIIESGTRLFQICAPGLFPIQVIKIISCLDATSRGSGGFGSTGK